MTKERYLKMMEQLGKEPIESEIPPDWDDFPPLVHDAVNIFNSLGDRVYPDIGYIGKDYTLLPSLVKIYNITDEDLLIELLNWLDGRAIKKSADTIKQAHEKMKRRANGAK